MRETRLKGDAVGLLAVCILVVPAFTAISESAGVKVVKGTATTDGTLTPGSVETLSVSHMPRHFRFIVGVNPKMTPNCGSQGLSLCLGAAIKTPSGKSKWFRTTGRGRATVTFTMPTSYRRLTLQGPSPGEQVFQYQPGDVVLIVASGLHSGILARAKAVATVG